MKPTVLIAILAKDAEVYLPLYLKCITQLDYPKDRIYIYIRTNNNRDKTVEILTDWVDTAKNMYRWVQMDCEDIPTDLSAYKQHDWNKIRFKVLGEIRQRSIEVAIERDVDFYFVVDIDNFIQANTLKNLVRLNFDVVAPFLPRKNMMYANYHHCVNDGGYYTDCEMYSPIRNQSISGLIECSVVHCAYLIHRRVLSAIQYVDETERHEYIIFSDTCRRNGITQYLDNREIYGYLFLTEPDEFTTDEAYPEILQMTSSDHVPT